MRQNLPKIRFDNPNLDIEVERVKKKKEERWRPEIELEFSEYIPLPSICSNTDRFRGWKDDNLKFA